MEEALHALVAVAGRRAQVDRLSVRGLRHLCDRHVEVAGASVRFESPFTTHPLVGGVVEDEVASPDPTSPIPEITAGTSVVVPFPRPGAYGYYCTNHANIGMTGAVFVQ